MKRKTNAGDSHSTRRESVLAELKNAFAFLSLKKMGHLIPEVRSNLGFALPGASGYGDIAAFPGRITQIGDEIFAFRDPAFDASRHIARVILAAMHRDPQLRSAMNIRYSTEILEACKKADLGMALFDRRQEPKDLKEREGSSLEWGTRQALLAFEGIPDLVYDEGEVGKEPMIRILGKKPMQVAEKIVRIKLNLKNIPVGG